MESTAQVLERPHATEEHHGHAHPQLSFLEKYVFSLDHKVIGIQFMFSSLFFLLVGGWLALL
ncbi:MAG: hypothetical protein ABIR47_04185, partial [Candidatus Kapaibacterium sp.]